MDACGPRRWRRPVNTDLVFDKFSDCLSAEAQMRQHYSDAFDAWDRLAAARIDRRSDYKKARELEAKRLLSNVGTCVPHGGANSAAPAEQLEAAARAIATTRYAVAARTANLAKKMRLIAKKAALAQSTVHS